VLGGWWGGMTARAVERACYVVGAVLMASGLVHLGVLVVTGGSWQGPLSWRKPTTFGVSFGLTLITIAWVASYIRLGRRTRNWLLGLFAGACVLEVSLIFGYRTVLVRPGGWRGSGGDRRRGAAPTAPDRPGQQRDGDQGGEDHVAGHAEPVAVLPPGGARGRADADVRHRPGQ
jgi:hypothetical protein